VPAEGPFATVVWVPPVGFGGCVFGPPLPLPCPANDGAVAMNTAATTVAITEFFLAIMAPLQRAIDRKVHAATPARCAVSSILLSGTYLALKQKGLYLSLTDSSPR
jgi:hypothetical protein